MKDRFKEAFFSWDAKKIAILVLSIFLIFFIFVTFFILYLTDKNNELNAYKDFIKEDMNTQNTILQKNLDEQIFYYIGIKNRIAEFELALDIKSYEEKVTKDDLRADYLLLSKSQKEKVLQLIPNGEVIKKHRGVSDYFGERIHPISKIKNLHKGIDYRVNLKTPIFSPANGVVDFVGIYGTFGYLVIIKHDFGFKTYYAHLDSKPIVRYKQVVKKGEHIANSGNTGLSTGPHLHYEVRYHGVPLDPKNFIEWGEKNFEMLFKKEAKVKWEDIINSAVNKKDR